MHINKKYIGPDGLHAGLGVHRMVEILVVISLGVWGEASGGSLGAI